MNNQKIVKRPHIVRKNFIVQSISEEYINLIWEKQTVVENTVATSQSVRRFVSIQNIPSQTQIHKYQCE